MTVRNTVAKKLDLPFDDSLPRFMLEPHSDKEALGLPPLTEKRNAAFLSSVFLTMQASKKGTVLRMKSRNALEHLPPCFMRSPRSSRSRRESRSAEYMLHQ